MVCKILKYVYYKLVKKKHKGPYQSCQFTEMFENPMSKAGDAATVAALSIDTRTGIHRYQTK